MLPHRAWPGACLPPGRWRPALAELVLTVRRSGGGGRQPIQPINGALVSPRLSTGSRLSTVAHPISQTSLPGPRSHGQGCDPGIATLPKARSPSLCSHGPIHVCLSVPHVPMSHVPRPSASLARPPVLPLHPPALSGFVGAQLRSGKSLPPRTWYLAPAAARLPAARQCCVRGRVPGTRPPEGRSLHALCSHCAVVPAPFLLGLLVCGTFPLPARRHQPQTIPREQQLPGSFLAVCHQRGKETTVAACPFGPCRLAFIRTPSSTTPHTHTQPLTTAHLTALPQLAL